MKEIVKRRWLTDNDNQKIAPKTTIDQILMEDGGRFENEYQNLKDHNARYYNCVEDMKNDSALQEGMIAVTLGYYEPNDGGKAIYHIVKNKKNIIDFPIANGAIASYVIDKIINISALGIVAKEEFATKNTQIVQTLISNSIDFFVDKDIYINDSLYFDFNFNHHEIQGNKKTIIMVADNKPIFYFNKILTQDITFNNFYLKYKNYQREGMEKSVAIYFETPLSKSWGWYNLFFSNMFISNAYVAIGSPVGSEPVWDCWFYNIGINDVYRHAVILDNPGQLDNYFINLRVHNYFTRQEDFHNKSGYCFDIKGSASFYDLDTEDWWGPLFLNEDASGAMRIERWHIERCHFKERYFTGIFISGNFVINDVSMYQISYDCSYGKFISLNDLTSAQISNIRWDTSSQPEPHNGLFAFIEWDYDSEFVCEGIKGFDYLYGRGYGPILSNRKGSINGVPLEKLICFDDKPINYQWKKGDLSYSSKLTSGASYCWIALGNTANQVKKLPFLISVNYSTLITVNNPEEMQKTLSSGDAILINDQLYIVNQIGTTNTFTVTELVKKNISNGEAFIDNGEKALVPLITLS